ncbi:reverse transcriptase domain-containing protein [Globicatella sulfidifaciens]
MTVWEVEEHIEVFYLPLRQKLLNGTYKPKPVKRVEIPKPNGTKRKLGIPCARDRVVQQAIRQVIEPIIDPHFLPQSHGFRPGKGTHIALKQCVAYYEEGYKVVVDCDLKQCFDTLNHDKLMYHLEQFIQDKAILKIIRKFSMSVSRAIIKCWFWAIEIVGSFLFIVSFLFLSFHYNFSFDRKDL